MSRSFLNNLVDDASLPFLASGRFAYHYARGKLGGDPIFRELLRRGVLPDRGHLLDLGCGQGCLCSWLLTARQHFERGQWPMGWAPAPDFQRLRGIELMQSDVDRAGRTFGADHPVVRVEQGDMNDAEFGQADVVTILDALHYFNYEQQAVVLRRIFEALPVGGLFLTRIGDASAGLPFHVSNWVDHAVTFARGHRLPRLYCRTLADWKMLLHDTGFNVESDHMSEGKPFANVMLVCRVPA